jgi:hypothetical protein
MVVMCYCLVSENDMFHDLTSTALSVVDDMGVDSEAPVVTLSTSSICRLSLSEILVEVGLRVVFIY